MLNWKRNPKAPSSLWDGLVLDGAYAGLHPHTNRFVDGSGLENHGVLTNMDAATDWVWSDELGRHGTYLRQATSRLSGFRSFLPATADFTFCAWARLAAGAAAHNTLIGSGQLLDANLFLLYLNTTFGAATNSIRLFLGSELCVGSDVREGEYHHYALTRSGSNFRVLIDGALDCSGVSAGSISPIDQTLGNIPNYGFLQDRSLRDALIDPLCVHRALAPAEITWLADPANHLYVPATRRHFWFPMSRPWLYARTSSVIIGGGIA